MKVPFKASALGADMISLSAHKIHGPKGVGALYISKTMRPVSKLLPYIMGGGQESGMRAGTENLPGIAAFGAAAEEARKSLNSSLKRMTELRDHAIARLTTETEGVVIIGGGTPHILSLSMPGYPSEVVMNYLERDGICIAKSSACKKGGRSHVLEAIGLAPNVIDSALRISFSRFTTLEEVDALCDGLLRAKQQLFPTLG
jgi:cysteine desulfurase